MLREDLNRKVAAEMIDAECQFFTGNRWSKAQDGRAGLGASNGNHAERAAYDKARQMNGGAKTFRVRQNAFPCVSCTAFFLSESKLGRTIVMDCTSNEGCYARECGFLASPFVPAPSSGKQEDQLKGALYFVGGRILSKHKTISVKNEGTSRVSFEGRDMSGGYQGNDGVTDELARLRSS